MMILDEGSKTSSSKKVPLEFEGLWGRVRISTVSTLGGGGAKPAPAFEVALRMDHSMSCEKTSDRSASALLTLYPYQIALIVKQLDANSGESYRHVL
jgi:hypothetical protein